MTICKRILAIVLCVALILPILPANVFAADDDVCKIDNGYIEVSVSRKNGGFLVNTVQGNLLKKSDNNKDLLFRSDGYDTSFVSFRVGSGADAKDYLFGGKYDTSGDLSVSQAAEGGDIVATWSVDGITFTQTVSLAADNASEHGMVSIGLSAQNNSGKAVPIRARVLLDTCLGSQDYAYYQVSGGSLTHTLQTEQIITDAESLKSFYALDDLANPLVAAYTVSSPYQAAIGHWNNLASSLFDFAPDTTLNFTNAINDYLTADSACAMYYDLGTVEDGASGSAVSYYGVYSNHNVNLENSIAINTVAPLRLDLNDEKTAYVRQSSVGVADFSIKVSAENYKSAASKDLENVILAVRSTSGVRSLDDHGQVMSDFDYDTTEPFTIPYSKIKDGEIITKDLFFQAQSPVNATYERITIGMYKDSVTSENLLGEKTVYLLLPGSDGNVPKVSFTAMTPGTVYSSGTRHLYVSVTNQVILENALEQGICVFKAYSADGKTVVDIPSDSISVNDGVADIALSNDLALALGSWYLQLEWTDDAVSSGVVTSEFRKQTASVLNFTVSDDPKFKNDCYGVLAAVKYEVGTGSAHTFVYKLESFKDEEAFKAFRDKENPEWKEILLVFRGEFTGDNRYPVKDTYGKVVGYRYYTGVSKKSVDSATRETKVENCITINNCVDFEGGTMSVYFEDYANPSQDRALESAILCEFDGELYTSDARTSVWTGKAALTKLEQGKEFALIQYNENGVRKSTEASAITLIWPNVWSYAQTLAGCAFKLAYGQFGIMKQPDGTEIGRTIAFAASLSLSFMTSPKQDPAETPDTYFGRMKDLWQNWRGASIYQYAYSGDHLSRLLDFNMNDGTDEHDKAKKGVQASVMVPDILFGCGEGFVGLNFTVDIAVQNMIDSLPKVTGKLSINTINNWSFGLAGSCKFTDNMKLEAKLSFKSYENIPIPDEYYFFIGGIKPGINIDGGGVVWITGAGGGISNIYDTIFCTSGLPPLKLTMVAAFSIVQVLDGTAKLELSLSGLNLTASDLKIKGEIEVIQKIQLGLQWYPDLKLTAGIYVSMFEKVIEGQGYIILLGKDYTDWFFEAFIRAQLKVPESVPGVGGMTILGADLGISTEKIWGAFTALCVTVGLSYYWGEDDVNFGSDSDKAQPTYPNLLLESFDGECNDFPIAYDEENHRTLYAHFGTNFEAPKAAQVLSERDLILMDAAGVWSTTGKTSHKFNLGAHSAANNAATMVQMNFAATSLEQAKTLAQSFTVKDAGGASFPITFYDGSNIDTANANVTWDEASGTATFAFTVTDASRFNKNWFITTGTTPADVVLYNVLPMPELTEVSIADNLTAGTQVDVTWDGSGLDELDNISFYLASSNDPSDADAELYPLTVDYDPYAYPPVSIDIPSKSAALNLSADVPSGEYYLRAVYAKDEQLNGVLHSAGKVTVTNANTPAAIGVPTVSPVGDRKLGVTVPAATDANTTGYQVTVLNADGTATDISGMNFAKAESGATVFEVGGSYEAPVRADASDPDAAITGTEVCGLEGGKSYIVEITPYKTVDTDADGEDDAIVYGTTYRSGSVALPTAVTPTATLRARGKPWIETKDLTDSSVLPVYTESSLVVEAGFSETVSGTWTLDSSDLWAKADGDTSVVSGSFNNIKNTTFTLSDLTDGDHTLTVVGSAADGDSFAYSYHFTVDTTAPRLILSSPLNGSPFNPDGTVTVSGVTDADAAICLSIDGGLPTELAVTTDANGVFTQNVDIPYANNAATHSLAIYAVDPHGNRTETREISVTHPGFGDLSDIEIMVDGAVPADGVVQTPADAENLSLTVVGVTSNGTRFAMDPTLVVWRSQAAEGAITVDDEGKLSYSAFTKGFVEAMLEVSTGAYLTASVALSTETPSSMVAVSMTLGGRVTGGGSYDQGESVVLMASAEEGYRFDHWEITGVNGLDGETAETIRFTMPNEAVTVVAHFVPLILPGDLNGDGEVNALDLIRLKRYLLGEDVELCCSGDLNGNGFVNTLDLIRLKKYLLSETVELH